LRDVEDDCTVLYHALVDLLPIIVLIKTFQLTFCNLVTYIVTRT
jgi:hypothetical protein